MPNSSSYPSPHLISVSDPSLNSKGPSVNFQSSAFRHKTSSVGSVVPWPLKHTCTHTVPKNTSVIMWFYYFQLFLIFSKCGYNLNGVPCGWTQSWGSNSTKSGVTLIGPSLPLVKTIHLGQYIKAILEGNEEHSKNRQELEGSEYLAEKNNIEWVSQFAWLLSSGLTFVMTRIKAHRPNGLKN